jgi:hypothetical protein
MSKNSRRIAAAAAAAATEVNPTEVTEQPQPTPETAPGAETTPTTTPTAAPATEDPAALLYRAERARRDAERAAKKVAASSTADGPKRLASGRLSARGLPCLCGCGASTTTRDARFLSGHDAKMRAAILKQGLATSAIPDVALPFFKDGGAIAGLLLADVGTEQERIVDVKTPGGLFA